MTDPAVKINQIYETTIDCSFGDGSDRPRRD
jgi:hypothetical protein